MADATSYAEASSGSFTVSATNSIGVKVAAAILPIDGSTWKDVKNDITATIRGGATISQEGATGDIVAGARYTDFDGSDDVIDMGRSYTQHATTPIAGNWSAHGGPADAVFVIEHDLSDGTILSERDGGTDPMQFFTTNSGANIDTPFSDIIVDTLSTGVYVIGASLVNATTLIGYKNGSADNTVDPGTPATGVVNLSIGARWQSYPTTAYQYSGKVYLVLLFNEALSSAEHSSLNSNPWQVFDASSASTALPLLNAYYS